MKLMPRESGEFVVRHAKHVKTLQDGVNVLSEEILSKLKTKELDVINFSQHNLHPNKEDTWAIDWIFVVDTLNFCFWTPGIDSSTKYRVIGQTGYFALCAAINRAMKENIDILNPNYYSRITFDELKSIMRSDDGQTSMPLLTERVQCLHEVGKTLLEKYNGTFLNCIKSCNNSAQALLSAIVTDFNCFRDEAMYKNQHVSLYKRAQILVGDIWAYFHGKGHGYFTDIGTITMFADYRVPQVLVHFKALEYSTELNEFLKLGKLMENGCEEEVEIRAASIHIVELVKNKIHEHIKADKDTFLTEESINSILIDHFLWDYRRQHAEELNYIPFHKVLCIYY